jgi:hypothetical protein
MLKMRTYLEKNQMAGIYFFHGQMPEMRFPMVVAILIGLYSQSAGYFIFNLKF